MRACSGRSSSWSFSDSAFSFLPTVFLDCRVTAEISVAIAATPAELAVKREALLAHASQITPEMLSDRFVETYELEWYLRHGPAAALEQLGNAHALV